MKVRELVAAAIALCVFGAGCATNKEWGKGAMRGALIGAGIGGGAGVGIGVGAGDEGASELGRDGALGAAAGLIIGGIAGHYLWDEPPADERAEPTPTPLPEPAKVEPEEVVVIQFSGEKVEGFDFNSADLPASALPLIQSTADKILTPAYAERVIRIEGHTDSIGSTAYNQALGMRRARAVAQALSDRGVAPQRLSVKSLGARNPIASNETEEGRALNRRVEIRINGHVDEESETFIEEDAAEVEEAPDRKVVVAEEAAVVEDSEGEVEGEVVEEVAEVEPANVEPAKEPEAAVDTAAVEAMPAPTRTPIVALPEKPPSIYFAQDSVEIDAAGGASLTTAAEILQTSPHVTLLIEAFSDKSESDSSLSERRADAVRSALSQKGIDASRLATRPWGRVWSVSNEPASQNRRVEFKVNRSN